MLTDKLPPLARTTSSRTQSEQINNLNLSRESTFDEPHITNDPV